MALFVELVKADALAAGSRKQIDRYGNQPEREMSLPDGMMTFLPLENARTGNQ